MNLVMRQHHEHFRRPCRVGDNGCLFEGIPVAYEPHIHDYSYYKHECNY